MLSLNIKNKKVHLNSENNLIRNIERRWRLLWQNIKIKENFYDFLDRIDEKDEIKIFKKQIFQKIFIILNRATNLQSWEWSTQVITSMFDYSWKNFLPELIDNNEIKELFKYIKEKNIKLASITSMQNKLWLPNLRKLKELIKLCKKENINLASVTGMQHWKGIPNIWQLLNIIKICKSENIDFQSITSMQHWKWLPNPDLLREFIDLVKKYNLNLKEITKTQEWIEKTLGKLKIIYT